MVPLEGGSFRAEQDLATQRAASANLAARGSGQLTFG